MNRELSENFLFGYFLQLLYFVSPTLVKYGSTIHHLFHQDFPYYHRNIDKYPTIKEQERWVRMYIKTFLEQQKMQQENNGSSNEKIVINEQHFQVKQDLDLFIQNMN